MDYVEEAAAAAALEALMPAIAKDSTATQLEGAAGEEARRAADAEFLRSRSEVENALGSLIRAVNGGGMVSAATIVTIIEALPIKYREAIERALLSRNSRVTDFAAVTTALLGCNTAIYLISSGIAATMSTFYLLEYITKNPAMRENSLSLALAAHESAMKVSVCRTVSAQTTDCMHCSDAPSSLLYQFPSKAADKGTPVRDALLWLEKAMNSGISQGEMPAMKASSLLLNTQQEPSSHTPKVLNVKSAFLFAKRYMAQHDMKPNFGHAAGDDLAYTDNDEGEASTDEVSLDAWHRLNVTSRRQAVQAAQVYS